MAHSPVSPVDTLHARPASEFPAHNEASASGVSWAAVIAGAFVAAAVSLILFALGAGAGLSSVSPWSGAGASVAAVGMAAIIWLIIVQIIASSMGGYIAGRLRTKWTSLHTDEVYFRDTAHGFLVWAVGLVITAAFLTSAVASMVGGAAQLGATASSGSSGMQASGPADPNAYFVDTLFRSSNPTAATPDQNSGFAHAEVGGILANALRQKNLAGPDKSYLAQLVAARTGLTQAEAEQRVSDVFMQAQQAADTARKAIAHSLYWTFLALLIGAFCASYAATMGGKQRDRMA